MDSCQVERVNGIFVCRWLVANPQADTATRVLRRLLRQVLFTKEALKASFRDYVETTVLQGDKTGRNAPMANHPG